MFRKLFLLSGLIASYAGSEPLVILVSIDGCRWDYPELHQAKTLQDISTSGLRVRQLTPCYPTKTFPNHYSLVTGLRPESHGIIQNKFWDDDFRSWFGIGAHPAAREGRWWGGEPIWITARKNGLRSATMFWPGSEADIMGQRPNRWVKYNGNLSEFDRVKQVLAWTSLPQEERPNFVALYFEAVDSAGHDFGPEARETQQALHHVDHALAALRDGLKQQGLWDTANVIITSDHGMTAINAKRTVFLDDLVQLDAIRIVFDGAVGGLDPLNGESPADLVAKLDAHPHLRAFAREDMPSRLHFSHHERIPKIVIIPDLGWELRTRESFDPHSVGGGDHGFDPIESDMASVFVAHGPAFAPGSHLDQADIIDVYNLLCKLLEIVPAPNEGSAILTEAISPNANRSTPAGAVSGR